MADVIRLATPADSEEILKIYTPFVLQTTISYETEVPSQDAFAERIANIGAQYPYLLYYVDDALAGYCYATKFKERQAYRFDVETSIYLNDAFHRRGIGKELYSRLFRLLREQGYYNAYAGVSLPNEKSIGFHEAMGYTLVGTYHSIGHKLGKWLDAAWFEKPLREKGEKPEEPVSIRSLPRDIIEEILKL